MLLTLAKLANNLSQCLDPIRFHLFGEIIKRATKKQVCMIRKTKTTHYRPTHGTVRKSHRTLTVTRYQKNNQNKAISSLLFVKMIAKLEKISNNTIQSKNQTQNPTNNGTPSDAYHTKEQTMYHHRDNLIK